MVAVLAVEVAEQLAGLGGGLRVDRVGAAGTAAAGGRRGRGGRAASCGLGPALVGLTVAGPQLHLGAGRGGRAGHVEAQPRLHAGDAAVAVDPPLLVGLPVAGPRIDRGTRGGLVVVGVQAQRAVVDAQLVGGGGGPGLVRGAVAVPDLHQRASGPAGAGDVEAAAGRGADERRVGRRRRGRRGQPAGQCEDGGRCDCGAGDRPPAATLSAGWTGGVVWHGFPPLRDGEYGPSASARAGRSVGPRCPGVRRSTGLEQTCNVLIHKR